VDGIGAGLTEFEGAQLNSVFDSEEDQSREGIFSEDEELSDAEEKLTSANIEGLSRKLDRERELVDEQAELELKDSVIQTNIADDRPDVFGENRAHLRPQVAPDLQLLRTRIMETIHILSELATLGQPGKLRTDYITLLINDICTYYGYTPYLAEK